MPPGVEEWMSIVQRENERGTVVLVADTHHALLWDEQDGEVTKCRGCPSFPANSAPLIKFVEQWAKANEKGCPR